MNIRPFPFAALLGLALLPPVVRAQASSAATATRSAAGAADTVVLSPFTVSTDRDTGFVAANALSGGRLNTSLRDTAADYSVQTRDFLDALGLTNLSEAASWTVNAYDTGEDGQGAGFGNPLSSQLRFRGLSANTQQIDFFPVNYDYDTFSVERLDYARGASGVLFGTGSFTGTPNAVLKRARVDRTTGEVRMTGGSWDHYRATLDVNYALTPKLALRFNLLGQDSHTYRQAEFNDRKAISLGATVLPWRGASVSLVVESGRFDRNIGPTQLRDFFTGWTGTQTFSGPMGVRADSGQYPTTNPNPNQAGVARLGSNTATYYLVDTSDPSAPIMNYANTARTLASAEGSTGPTGTSVGGVFLPAGAPDPGLRGVNIINGADRPENLYDRVIANSNYRTPSRSVTLLSSQPNNVTIYDTITLTGTQQVGQHLFLEAAGNFADRKIKSKTTITGTIPMYIDINRDLPDGRPNPNFLQAYTDRPSGGVRQHSISRNLRAGAALVFDDTRFGDYTLSVSGGGSLTTSYRRRTLYSILDPNVDPRLWPITNVPTLRFYVNDGPYTDEPPARVTLVNTTFVGTGPTATPVVTRREASAGYVTSEATRSRSASDYQIAALQAKLLKRRVSLLAAARRDAFETINFNMWNAQQRQYELPANWDGVSEYFKPAAPADYNSLTYTPRDANGNPTGPRQTAVARPRAGNGSPLPQYANDRFQDDYSNPRQKVADTVFSGGAVVHITPWLSLTGGYGESFNAPSTAARITGLEFDPVLSSTTSYGVRLTAPNNRLSFTASRYSGKQDNVAVSGSAGLPTNLIPWAFLNEIINANRYDDFSTEGINRRGIAPVPISFSEIGSRKTEGWEFEAVANPLRGLRVSANFAIPEATLTGGFAETRAYIAQFEPTLRQIVEDAGVVIGADNRASVRAAGDPLAGGIDAGNAVRGWNSMQDFKRAASGSETKENRLNKYSANVFVDYTLQQGRLKGLRFGLGAQFRGKTIVGNRGTDTIRDPNNPALAIDDPNLSSTDYVWADGYYQVTSTLGYEFRLSRKLRMRLDLRVENLTDFDQPLYNASVLRIVKGDLTDPARKNTFDGAYYLRPRYWELTSTLKF